MNGRFLPGERILYQDGPVAVTTDRLLVGRASYVLSELGTLRVAKVRPWRGRLFMLGLALAAGGLTALAAGVTVPAAAGLGLALPIAGLAAAMPARWALLARTRWGERTLFVTPDPLAPRRLTAEMVAALDRARRATRG